MEEKLICCLCILIAGIVGGVICDNSCSWHESLLLRQLLNHSRYDPAARPVLKVTDAVSVTMDMELFQILELDERTQILSFNAIFHFFWTDPYLTWTPADYGHVWRVTLPWNRVWVPDIAFYNRISQHKTSSETFNTGYVTVTANGSTHFIVPGQLRASCKIDVRYFPFDQQQCTLHFGSWTYDIREVYLNISRPRAITSTYVQNEQWTLVGVPAKVELQAYPNWPEDVPFADALYTIIIRRKPMFTVYYYVLPAGVLLTIGLLVFVLPVESGEKVSLGITVLLSLTVYQLSLSNIVPKAETIPVLGKFFGGAVVFLSVTTMTSVFLANIHFRGNHGQRVPRWLHNLVLVYMAKVVGARSMIINASKYPEVDERGWCVERNGKAGRTNPAIDCNNHNVTSPPSAAATTMTSSATSQNNAQSKAAKQQQQQHFSSQLERCNGNIPTSKHPTLQAQSCGMLSGVLDNVVEMKEWLIRRHTVVEQVDHNKEEWKLVVYVLDRVFFSSLCLMVFVFCSGLFFNIPSYGDVVVEGELV